MMTNRAALNGITEVTIGAAIRVHKSLGPGLLESAYEACLAFELTDCGLKVERQKPLPLVYRDVRLDCGYRLDLLVGKALLLRLKRLIAFCLFTRHNYSRISNSLAVA
jgi:GxxExxY protein